MKRLAITAGAVLLAFGAATAEAAPTWNADPNAGVANAQAVGADAEVAAYGAMLLSFQQMQAPLLASFTAIGERFQSGRLSQAELSAISRELASLRTLAAEVARQIEVFPLPTISLLPIAVELQPLALRREQLSTIAELTGMIGHLEEGVAAIGRGNMPGARRAEAAVFESASTILRQRILFMRAAQATMERAASEWDFAEAEIVMLRSTMQFLHVFNLGVPMNRAELARQLTGLSEAMNQTRREASTKSLAERADMDASIERADLPPAAVRLLTRARAASAVDDDYVVALAEWEDLLTDAARDVADRRITQTAAARAIMPRFRTLRQRFIELEVQIATALADR